MWHVVSRARAPAAGGYSLTSVVRTTSAVRPACVDWVSLFTLCLVLSDRVNVERWLSLTAHALDVQQYCIQVQQLNRRRSSIDCIHRVWSPLRQTVCTTQSLANLLLPARITTDNRVLTLSSSRSNERKPGSHSVVTRRRHRNARLHSLFCHARLLVQTHYTSLCQYAPDVTSSWTSRSRSPAVVVRTNARCRTAQRRAAQGGARVA